MQYYIEFTSHNYSFFHMVLFNFFFLCKQKTQINSLFWRSNIIIEKEKIKLSAYRKNYSVCFIIPARNEEKTHFKNN